MPTIIQSIGVSGDFGQMSFNDPYDGVAFSSSGTSEAPDFSLTDLAQSMYIKEYETLKYKIGINKNFAATQYALDVSGDIRVESGVDGDRQGSHIRVHPSTQNYPGPNKIVLYEYPYGIGQTPTTSIGLGVDTNTLKFHSTSDYKWYYNASGTWDYIKDASGNNISVGKMPTENGTLAMQLTDNDLSLNGNLIIHGDSVNFSQPSVKFSIDKVLDFSDASCALILPTGSTSDKSLSTATNGMIRYNNELQKIEQYVNSWSGLKADLSDLDGDTFISVEEISSNLPQNNNQISFFTGGSKRMLIDNDGKMSIGVATHDPSANLHILTNSTDISNNIPTIGITSMTNSDFSSATGTHYPFLNLQTTGGTDYLRLNAINYNTGVSGTDDQVSYTGFGVSVKNGSTGIVDNAMVVHPNGNVGFGTNLPAGKVHIRSSEPSNKPALLIEYAGNNKFLKFNATTGSVTDTTGIQFNKSNIELFSITGNDQQINFGNSTNATLTTDISNNLVGVRITNPTVSLDISGNDAIKIPIGTSAQRPSATNSAHLGLIRYNTTTSAFEGFGAGNTWGSLGGVNDVDQDTYISAETSAGFDNDELKFFTAGSERMTIENNGYVGIGTNNPTSIFNIIDSNGGYLISGSNASYNSIKSHTTSQSTGRDLLITTNDAGNNGIYIKANGNVGIGNNNPTAALDVDGSIKFTGDLELSGGMKSAADYILESASTSHSIRLKTGSTERFRIQGDGKVGIGSQAPNSELDVNGSIRGSYNADIASYFGRAAVGYSGASDSATFAHVNNNTTTSYAFMQSSDGVSFMNSANNKNMHFRINNVDNMVLTSDGKFGIGTNSPAVKLVINSTDAIKVPVGTTAQRPSTSGTAQYGFIRYNTTTNSYEGFGVGDAWGSLGGIKDVDQDTYISAETSAGSDNDELKFFTAGSERMTIENNGYVGIGTNSPAVKLVINSTDAIKVPVGTTAQRPSATGTAHQGYIRYNTTTSSYEGFGAGNTWGSLGGIKDVDQDTYISAETTAGADNDELKFFTAGSERMTIENNGYVGIGTNSPAVKLDINSTDAIKVPVGTTAQRPTATGTTHQGYIRYNTTTSSYEGFGAGNAWGSLGGIKDVDQDTYISAETTAGADNDELKFFTAGTERASIGSTGNVTIKNDLTVDGDFNITGVFNKTNTNVQVTDQLDISNNGTGPALIARQHGTANIADFYDDTALVMRIKNGGNIGIGTDNPVVKLQVGGNASGQSSGNNVVQAATFQVFDENYRMETQLSQLAFRSQGGNGIGFYTTAEASNNIDNSKMIIKGSNVGIGTISPSEKLHVNGDIKLSGSLKTSSLTISQAELGYLDGVTASIQTQLNDITSGGISISLDGISDVKSGGTNFSESLLIGNSTTGTLNAANYNTGVGAGVFGSLTSGDENTASGYYALSNNTTGSLNTANGAMSLYWNTTGSNNTASGYNALKENTTGSNNSAYGINTLNKNTTGYYNTAIGNTSLYANTTGHNNIATGYRTLRYNTTGNYNTAYGNDALYNTTNSYNSGFGNDALYSNTTGEKNTASGYQALYSNTTGNLNAASGYQALYSNTTASSNTATGRSALYSNTTGDNNTAVGAESLYFNTTGNHNSATGYQALTNNTTGSSNTAHGWATLNKNTTGANNVATGKQALFSNTTGANSVATGYHALYSNTDGGRNVATGYESLKMTTGSYNTAYGYQAGDTNTTGTYNTFLGYNTGSTSNNLTKATSIGWGATATASNQIRLGTATETVSIPGDLSLTGTLNSITSTELGYLDGVTSNIQTQIDDTALAAASQLDDLSDVKFGGTNFNNSLLIGNTTTGTLSSANYNTGVGVDVFKALTSGDYNTAIGHQTLKYNTTGKSNTATGRNALLSNTTGDYNVATGVNALQSNTEGDNNVATGYQSLFYNTTGTKNVAYGYQSLFYNTTGDYNVANGYHSLFNNTTGANNLATGRSALMGNTTGSNNTAVGRLAGDGNTTGSYNTFLGYNTDNNANNLTKTTAIGCDAIATASNQIRLGTATETVSIPGNLSLTGTLNSITSTEIGYLDGVTSNIQTQLDNTAAAAASQLGDLSDVKYGGSNFSDSLLIGNTTTGTLANANYNVGIGPMVFRSLTSGDYNVATGFQSLRSNTTGSSNSAFGMQTLYANTSGANNTAIGYTSLRYNTTGLDNTATGYSALFNNTTGYMNTAIGKDALRSNTTGWWNVANGKAALMTNTTGKGNVAIGYHALYLNTTGEYNTATGRDALRSNTTGSNNVAYGNVALYTNTTGSYNTATGQSALQNNTYGANNTAIGYNSLMYNITGGSNVAIGYESLKSSTGSQNVALGFQSLYSTTSGASNTAIGYQSLRNYTGHQTTALGYYSLQSNTTGTANTASGYKTLAYTTTGARNAGFGWMALNNNTTGSNNTSIGWDSGDRNTTGSNNTYLGYNADANSNNLSNSTAIGYNATITASNQIMLGTSSETVSIPGDLSLTGTLNNITSTEIGYLDGVTSNIQTQIDDTAAASASQLGDLSDVKFGGSGFSNSLLIGHTTTGSLNNANENVGVGIDVFTDLTSGHSNTAVGNNSLSNNTSANNNSAFGRSALRKNTTGASNTAVGSYSLNNNTTGSNNTAVGIYSLTNNTNSNQNTAFGAQTLFNNQSGLGNVAIGFGSLYRYTGGYNVAVGYHSLYNTISGSTNTAVGYQALYNYTGSQSVGIGYQALYDNTSGTANVALGYKALQNVNTGARNTGIGWMALSELTTGSNNIAVGHDAGDVNTTGSNNTYLGKDAKPNANDYSNSTAIGYGSQITASNQVVLGRSSETVSIPGNALINGNLTVSGTTTTINTTNTTISDNLIELSSGLTSAANNDAGIIIERGSTGANAFMGWDESQDKFVLGTTTATGSSTGNLSITKGNLDINNVSATTITLNGTDLQTKIDNANSDISSYTVTVAVKTNSHPMYGSGSTNAFFLNGIEAPAITLKTGKTYTFDQSNSSNSSNTLSFWTDEDSSTAYTSNVTTTGTPGSTGAKTEIFVTETTPIQLYYQNGTNNYMGNYFAVQIANVLISNADLESVAHLSNVSSDIQTQIDSKQSTITGAATTIDTENLTVSRSLVSDASGKVTVSAVTSTEIGYLDGVTSNIQTQLNNAVTSGGQWTTVNTNELYYNSGNVGIGTNNPSALFHVNGSMVAAPDTNNASTFGRASIGYAGLSDAASFAHIDYNTSTKFAFLQDSGGNTYMNIPSTATAMVFRVDNVDKMRMLPNGNLGIATNSPSEKLHVVGNALITGNIKAAENSNTTSTFGQMEIGAVSAWNGSAILGHRNVVNNTTAGYALLQNAFGDTWINASNAARNLNFCIAHNSKMTIKGSNGFIGIGTEAPSHKLDIEEGIISIQDGYSTSGIIYHENFSSLPSSWTKIDGTVNSQTNNGNYLRLHTGASIRSDAIDLSANTYYTDGDGSGSSSWTSSRILLKIMGRSWSLDNASELLTISILKASDNSIIDVIYKDCVGTQDTPSNFYPIVCDIKPYITTSLYSIKIQIDSAGGGSADFFDMKYFSICLDDSSSWYKNSVYKQQVIGGLSVGNSYIGEELNDNRLIVQGKVGIGTTNPSEKLHVVGNIKLSGTLKTSTITLSQTELGYLNGVTSNIQTQLNNAGVSSLDGLSDVKFGGTNFTGSLLIGNTNTGTLSSANYNTGVGIGVFNALTSGANNVATGWEPLKSNTTGGWNIAIGNRALYSNTTGNSNTAIGNVTLWSNTTGANNVASGAEALFSNTTGYQNTASGYQALSSNTTGASNNAFGMYSLKSNTTANNNNAFGYSALQNTTGTGNVAFGHNAGNLNTTGTYNTYLGYNTDNNANNLTKSTAIGWNATATASNQIRLGTATETVSIPGKIGIGTDSSSTALQIGNNMVHDNNRTYDANALKVVHPTVTSNTVLNDPQPLLYLARDGTSGQAHSAMATFKLCRYENNGTNSRTRMDIDLTDSTFTDTNVMSIRADGRVGIGTTNPDREFNVYTNTNYGGMRVFDSTSSCVIFGRDTASGSGYINIWGGGNNQKVYFSGNSSVNSWVNTGSNFGVGTSSPTQKLHVSGSMLLTGSFVLGNNTWLSQTELGYLNGVTSNIQTQLNNAGGADALDELSDVKFGGANFTDSLLIGNTNTGTLNNALYNTGVGIAVFNALTSGDNNTATGYQSLKSNTTGGNNTATGFRALYSNTTGTHNTASGSSALYSNTTGYFNVANGFQTLKTNTTGHDNIAIGYDALYSNTTGYINTALGTQSLYSNTTGFRNIASGSNSLYANTTGSYNTVTGHYALNYNTTGSSNTALGYKALNKNTEGIQNTASGYQALKENTTGDDNVAYGYNALSSNTTASSSTAVGNEALASNTTGGYNTAFGNATLYSNTTGNDNLASGYRALYYNTTGDANVACGTMTLYQNTVGDYNVAVGAQTLRNNTTGTYNTATGYSALNTNTTGSNNVATGGMALNKNTTASNNTATGHYALYSNTTGDKNVATGSQALYSNTTGIQNTASGYEVLYSNTTGNRNTATGNNALKANTTGSQNTAYGNYALKTNTSGSYNNATGYWALADNTASYNTASGVYALRYNTTGANNTACGYTALFINSTGSGNVAIGYQAGDRNTTGTYNTFLGYNTDNNANNLTKSTSIGWNATATASNQIRLGTATETVSIPGDLSLTGTLNSITATEIGYLDGVTSNIQTQLNAAAGGASSLDGLSDVKSGGSNFSESLLIGNTITGTLANASYNLGIGSMVFRSLTSGDYNVATGFQSLRSNTTGSSNSAFGMQTLYANTTGNFNTAIGHTSLTNNTSGLDNTASGHQSLFNNTTGSYNTALGKNSLYSNTTGSNNTATGCQALQNNTTGSYNTASGLNSLISNTTGVSNTAVGFHALHANTTASYNTATGYQSLRYNTTGERNAAYGFQTLYSNTTGNYNTAYGNYALYSNTSGIDNTAVGYYALKSNTTGQNNMAIGWKALYYNTTGHWNSAAGMYSLFYNTTGQRNAASGYASLFKNTTGNYNTALGMQSLYTNQTGSNITAIGHEALHFNTASDSVAVGNKALYSNTTGEGNVATGYSALYANTTGGYNTAFGNATLYTNTTGNDNTATGYRALYYNTTGDANLANGPMTLYQNTTGEKNIAVGAQTLRNNTTGSYNAATGYSALNTNTTGYNNVAIGYQALNKNTTGHDNFASGFESLKSSTTASYNTATGSKTLYTNTTGYDNVATGYYALYANTTGTNNVATGYNALKSNTTGHYNIGTGPNALNFNTTGQRNIATGYQTLTNNTTGGYNTAYGWKSGYTNTTGTYNTFLGYDADNNANNLTKTTAIGWNATATASNQIRLGTATETVSIPGNVGIGTATTSHILTINTAGDGYNGIRISDNATNSIELGRDNENGSGYLRLKNAGSGTSGIFLSGKASGNHYINNGGRLGIGNNNPSYKLDVTGDINFTGTLYQNGSAFSGGGGASSLNGLSDVKYEGTNFDHSLLIGSTSTGTLTGASGNTGVGKTVFSALTSADYCNALGYGALASLTSGSTNSALGYRALGSNTNGYDNNAFGFYSLYTNTSGNFNNAHGNNSLKYNNTGQFNAAFGGSALQNTNASGNTGIGHNAGNGNTTGTYNTFLGYNTDNNASGLTKSTSIGWNATATASNQIRLGTATETVSIPGDLSLTGTLNSITATEIGYLDGVTSNIQTQLNAAGGASSLNGLSDVKSGGTSFVNSLLIGNATTGTLSNANYNTGVGIAVFNALTSGDNNTATGYQSLKTNTTGGNNTASGSSALYSNTTGIDNTASGYRALYYNTSGSYNNATGRDALFSNTTASNNTAIGYRALFSNTTASGNTAIGHEALYTNIVNGSNTACGYRALKLTVNNSNSAFGHNTLSSNTSGAECSAFGANALASNTTSYGNSAFGSMALYNSTASNSCAFGNYALYSNTTGTYNSAFGYAAMHNSTTGTRNTASGYMTLRYNTTGYDNTASGYQALKTNTTGYDNTATGSNALVSNTFGVRNVATGNRTLYSNTTGSNNIATGNYALNGNTTGSHNNAHGYWALASTTTGSRNTASGTYALRWNSTGYDNTAYGYESLKSSSGSYNTGCGYQAGDTNTTGNYNTFLGYGADNNANNLTKTTAIGWNAIATASNQIRLGTATETVSIPGILSVDLNTSMTPTASTAMFGSFSQGMSVTKIRIQTTNSSSSDHWSLGHVDVFDFDGNNLVQTSNSGFTAKLFNASNNVEITTSNYSSYGINGNWGRVGNIIASSLSNQLEYDGDASNSSYWFVGLKENMYVEVYFPSGVTDIAEITVGPWNQYGYADRFGDQTKITTFNGSTQLSTYTLPSASSYSYNFYVLAGTASYSSVVTSLISNYPNSSYLTNVITDQESSMTSNYKLLQISDTSTTAGTINLIADAVNGAKIGIGNISPSEALHVTGNIKTTGTIEAATWFKTTSSTLRIGPVGGVNQPLDGGGNPTAYLNLQWQTGTSGNILDMYFQSAYNEIRTRNSTHLVFNGTHGGNVGIKTTTPSCPLQVNGSAYIGSYSKYVSENNSYGNYSGSDNTSIYASSGIGCDYVSFHSDIRIKKNIVDVPDELALQQVRDIPCRYYEYIDYKTKGTEKTIGFIAQEVNEILPMAITKKALIIPDEYRLLENISWEEIVSTVIPLYSNITGNSTYKLSSDLTDVSGIKYKFIVANDLSDNPIEKEIIGNSDDTFTFDESYQYVFCYGKEIDDFHMVDKNKIFALHHSAIQQMDKLQLLEKDKVVALETKISDLETQNTTLLSKVDSLETQMAAVLLRLQSLENP